MRTLTGMSITFNTRGDEKAVSTIVHIFIKSRWTFNYTVTFVFTDESGAEGSFSMSSVRDAIIGVTVNQDCRDPHGMLTESPLLQSQLASEPPDADEILDRVTIEFATHHDNKHADTRMNVHIVNRLSATSAQDLAAGLDLFPGEDLPSDGALASDAIRLADIALPVVYIVIEPTGSDRWMFDYRVTRAEGITLPADLPDRHHPSAQHREPAWA